ncbi:MAG TPA: sensor histidine kinase [Gaiellales bacterium]|jgi:signal transduction histidine kinase|nr:sensor histidine kinase [Gaiellales bacterium]
MLSPSLSDRPSSTDRRPRPLGGTAQAGALAAITVAVTAVAFVASALVLPHPLALLGAGIVVIAALGGATVWLVHRDALRLRAAEDWHRRLRRELIVQSAFLDGLVGSLGTMSSIADPARALERAAEEAHRLVRPDATVLLVPGADGRGLRPAVARGIALGPIADLVVELDAEVTRAPVAGRTGTDALSRRLRPTATVTVPIAAMDELRGLLVLMRLRGHEPFGPSELTQASVLADFAATAATNALLFERVESLLAQARMRESERAELSRRVVSAEQDERRKLSLFLHDGPLQTMSGIAMMLDAVAEDTASGDVESALRVLDAARERQRGVVRSVRELSFALEPWVLRDRGFVAAVTALADEVERSHRVAIDLDVEAAADLSPDDQVFLYQIVREAVQNAVKHASPERVAVAVIGSRDRGFDVHVRDDGAGFAGGPEDDLPHHGLASMRERAQILGGRLRVSSIPGTGTTVQLSIPADAPDAA